MRLTAGHLLGGRLHYAQPADGYRTGIEPVLLAAGIPAEPGQRVLEAGTGAGAALMCLATRAPGIEGVGVEIDPGMAALARSNLAANGLPGLGILQADILAGPPPGRFHHALANPPWHAAAATPSRLARRRLAKQEQGAGLGAWIAALRAALLPGGTLTLILPAGRAAEAAAAMRGSGLHALVHTPFWPKPGRPAKLMLLAGTLADAGNAEERTAPGLVLHEADGRYTAEAEAVLRGGAALPS